MAVAIQVPGWCKVSVQQLSDADTGTLIELGRSRNGVTISYENFYLDVPGDEFGGDDGPPIDVQWLGAIARIRCEFTKYDRTVLDSVLALMPGSTFGAMGAPGGAEKYPGELMFTGLNYIRVLLQPALGFTRNYPRCIIRAPHEQNLSTKYASPIVEFEAHVHEWSAGDLAVHNTSAAAGFPGVTDS